MNMIIFVIIFIIFILYYFFYICIKSPGEPQTEAARPVQITIIHELEQAANMKNVVFQVLQNYTMMPPNSQAQAPWYNDI